MNTLKSALSPAKHSLRPPAKALTRREGNLGNLGNLGNFGNLGMPLGRRLAGGVAKIRSFSSLQDDCLKKDKNGFPYPIRDLKANARIGAVERLVRSTPLANIPLVQSSIRERRHVVSSEQQAAVEITYEVIGVLPRSFGRLYFRLINQVFSNVANLVMQEYKLARYLFLITLKCFFILLFVPFLVNLLAKQLLFQPINEFFWNHFQTDIFLNSYQEKQAFSEFKKFEEKIYFESIFLPFAISEADVVSQKLLLGAPEWYRATKINAHLVSLLGENMPQQISDCSPIIEGEGIRERTTQSKDLLTTYRQWINERMSKRLTRRTVELAVFYNNESIGAISNFFSDILSFTALYLLFFVLEVRIEMAKSFLADIFFGLEDSQKSFFLLLMTDLLVGYHSSNLWEFFFQFSLHHYGLPENQTGIFFLVATFPVLIDVLFKYLIFRQLNQVSPATVATLNAISE
jgi:hypothetical protein